MSTMRQISMFLFFRPKFNFRERVGDGYIYFNGFLWLITVRTWL